MAKENTTIQVNRSKSGTVVLFLFLAIFACFTALPIVYAVANSLKPLDELWRFPPKLYAENPTIKNYLDMFSIMSDSLVPFTRYIVNTVLITVIGTAGHIVLSSMCAYPLAKRKFPGRNAVFNTIVLSLMFNTTVTAVPNYLIMSKLHLIDNIWSLIIPTFGSSLGLYLMKQFMETGVPDALLEAACIDGASQWRIFWTIVMPCVKPAWLTLVLLSVQNLWTIGSTTYIYSDQHKTLAYALTQIVTGGIARAGVGSAVAVFMLIVPVTIFVFSQRNIINTMSSSGMKD